METNKIYNEDCLEGLEKMEDNSIDLVVDIFMGSGTTLVASKQLGRKFIGFDINPEYCKIAEERLTKTEVGIPPSLKTWVSCLRLYDD